MSDKPKGLNQKIFDIQSEVNRLKKDKMNPHFKNSYVDVNSVLDEMMPRFNENKLMLAQPLICEGARNIIKTIITDVDSGETFESSMVIQDNLDAQKTGSAITYYRRYMIVSMFGLQAVDDDGKAGSNSIKDNKVPTEDMILEIESLMNGNDKFRNDWLNFLGVQSFDKASYSQIEKAIKQIRG